MIQAHNRFLHDNEYQQLYSAGGATRARMNALIQQLGGQNPHLLNSTTSDCRRALDRLHVHLHTPAHPLNAYRDEIFPPSLHKLPEGLCVSPLCGQPQCPVNTERWNRLLEVLADFQQNHEPALTWLKFKNKHFLPNTNSYIPKEEAERLEKGILLSPFLYLHFYI